MVLHDLIFSSRVHQDFVGEIQVSFLLASRSVINSPYSFESGVLHFFVLLSYPIISVCGRLSPHNFEMFSISPQQAYSFVVDFLKNSVQSFLISSFIQFSFNSFQRFCVMSSSSIIPSPQVHILFLPFSAGVLPKSFHSYSFLISF